MKIWSWTGTTSATRFKKLLGDSGYEYSTTVHRNDVARLYQAFAVPIGDRDEMLSVLKARYHGDDCDSAIRDYLRQQGIPFTTSSWT
jgi:hypothetical protein